MIESHISFNVSLNGTHFFATAPRSCSVYDLEKAKKLAQELLKKFPESEGYEISCTRVECGGLILNTKSMAQGRYKS